MAKALAPPTSPSRRPLLRADSPWALALFASTLVLGVGVFTLPAEAARSGILVTGLILGLMWALTRRNYRRIVTLLGDRRAGTGDAFGKALDVAGAGPAGHHLALLGVAAFVVPATVSYVTIGARAIDALAMCLAGRPLLGTLLAVGGVWMATFGAARLDHPLCGRLARQLGAWSAGVSLTTYLHGTWRFFTGLAVFTVGVWLSSTGASAVGTRRRPQRNELARPHLTSIAALVLQVALMTVLAAVAVWTVGTTSAGFHRPTLIGDLTPRGMLVTVGVLAFALIGTGHTCLHAYPAMADPAFRRRTVDLSLRFVMALEATWVVVVCFTVRAPDLLQLDRVHATSAQGISRLVVANSAGWLAFAVQLIAAAVVGIGCTGAAGGFTESLALEIRHGLQRRNARRTAPATSTLKHGILLSAAAAAGIVEAAGIPLSAMLAVSGLTGGGVLLLIMGAIACPESCRQSRSRREAMGAAAITVLATTTLAALTTSGSIWAVGATTSCAAGLTLFAFVLTHRATASRSATHVAGSELDHRETEDERRCQARKTARLDLPVRRHKGGLPSERRTRGNGIERIPGTWRHRKDRRRCSVSYGSAPGMSRPTRAALAGECTEPPVAPDGRES